MLKSLNILYLCSFVLLLTGCPKLDGFTGNNSRTPDSDVTQPSNPPAAPPTNPQDMPGTQNPEASSPVGLIPCLPNIVTLIDSSGVNTNFTSIQTAIDASLESSTIYVGPGSYNEILKIKEKTNLTLRSECRAKIKGIVLKENHNINIQGFNIDAKATNQDAISIEGGNDSNKTISITNNWIQNTEKLYSGIKIEDSNQNIKIASNYLFNNSGNAILFTEQNENDHHHKKHGQFYDKFFRHGQHSKMGSALVSKNIIEYSGLNGVLVQKDIRQPIDFDSNDIIANSSYGIKIENDAAANELAFNNNIIAYSAGYFKTKKEHKDKDKKNKKDKHKDDDDDDKGQHEHSITADFYGQGVLKRKNSTGNLSTTGYEGFGFTKFVDVIKPQIIADGLSSNLYTNQVLYTLNIQILDQSPTITTVTHNSNLLTTSNLFYLSASTTLTEGANSITITSTDRVNNSKAVTANTIYLDTQIPVIQTQANDNVLTNQRIFPIPVVVTDNSPTTTYLYQNDVLVGQNADKNFTFNATLVEGKNTFKITCVDAAGNIANAINLTSITLDTVAPILTELVPADDDFIISINYPLSGRSNEPLQSITANGKNLNLSQDKLSFSAMDIATQDGPISITWVATDLAGNYSTVTINAQVMTKVINGQLITVEPLRTDSSKLIVKGAAGAARPGVTVTAKAGLLFNSGTAVANADGSFSIILDYFNQVTVSAYNSTSQETESSTVGYQVKTKLSGLVKDSQGIPINNATVRIQNIQSTTNTDGIFTFNDLTITGDQLLVIDGSTAIIPITGPLKKFSTSKVSINIGLNQINVLPQPIFLAPLILDGTQTQIADGAAAVVTSPNAPGVLLNIPASAVIFPDGTQSGAINIGIVNVEYTTIEPLKFAVPDTVVSLEPSGLSFNEPVQLTLPNDNELPDGVQMVIMSLNSQKGIWEIDGSAKVQGSQIVTEPGQGITHFSQIYPVPIGPVIQQVNNPEASGADTFNGALSTSISLSSFKTLGRDVTPSLTYKSSWAKPTAVVSTFFDIPKQEVSFSRTYSTTTDTVDDHKYCGTFSCVDYVRYFITSVYKEKTSSWYEPESIKGQFFVGGIQSAEVNFSGNPNNSVISYALDLKDPNTNQYLQSGIYPGSAKYSLKLKHMVLTTITKATNYAANNKEETRVTQDNYLETQVLEQVFPHDLNVNLYVQNETESPAGQGWKINGAQRIINTTSPRVLLEQEDGSLAIYSISNNINTLFDATDTNIDLSQGVDLSQWPKANVTSYDVDNKTTSVLNVNLTNGSQTSLGAMTNYTSELFYDNPPYSVIYRTQELPGYPFYGAKPLVYAPTWYRTWVNFQPKSKSAQLVQLGDGSVFGTDDLNSRLFQMAGSYNQKAGIRQYINPTTAYGDSYAGLQSYCSATAGQECEAYTNQWCTFIWAFGWGFYDPANYNPCGVQSYTDLAYGQNLLAGGNPTFNGDGNAPDVALNGPMGITLNPLSAQVVFADTGNNIVRVYDPNTNSITTIVGNGQNYDLGDGGAALQASLFHPRGVVYDSVGNLYISTENGYIRKVDTSGNISTIAGLPLEQGGILANQSIAQLTALNRPYGMVIDNANNFLYVADTANHRVLQLNLNNSQASVVAGNSTCDMSDSADNLSALNASLCNPTQIGLDNNNNLLIVDSGHQKIRRVVLQSNSVNVPLAYAPVNPDLSTLIKNTDGTWVRSLRNGNKIFFDQAGRQTLNQDRVGRQITYNYNAQGNLASITDPVNQTLTYQYNGSNQLNAIIDPAGKTTLFGYSGSQLTRVQFADGTVRTYSYSPDGLLLSETDERGNPTQYVYNQWNRLQQVTRADGTNVQVNDSASATVGNNYVGGNVGQLKSFGTLSGQVYDGIKDARNVTTAFVKDYRGFVTTVVDAQGGLTKIQRNLVGNPTLITRPDNTTVSFNYDANTNDLLSSTDTATGITQSYTYDSYGNQLTATDGRGFTTFNQFDANTGLQIAKILPGNRATYTTHNNLGLPIMVQQSPDQGASVLTTVYEYDSRGNNTRVVDTQNRETLKTYDGSGNVLTSSTKKDATNYLVTAYNYDALNRLASVTTPDLKTTSYTYLPGGLLSKITDPNNKLTTFDYDNLNRVVQKTSPLGQKTLMAYDGNGNVVSQKTPNGDVIGFYYDGLNQLVQKTLPDNTYNYAYDIRGNLVGVNNLNSQITFGVDVADRVTSVNSTGLGAGAGLPQSTLQFSYDANNNRLSMTDNSGAAVLYNYDELNRLSSLRNHKAEVFSFNYDDMSRLKQINRPGSYSQFSFDNSNFISSINHVGTGTIASFNYSRDGLGNVLSINTNYGNHSYNYDANSQLTSARHPASTGLGDENYSYDGVGNRLTDSNGNYVYDASSQRLNEDYRYLYIYDNNGNLIRKYPRNSTDLAYEYQYTSENQLKTVNIYNGMLSVAQYGPQIKNITYTYDALGRRVQKKINDLVDSSKSFTRNFIYDNQEIIVELDGSNQILARYTQSGLRTDDTLAVDVTSQGQSANIAQNAQSYYYLKDALGSVTDITDSSGNLVQHYNYTSFGTIQNIKDGAGTDITSNPIVNTAYTYTNRELDSETGNYYYRARYYDPQIGRFLQEDPDPGKMENSATVINKFNYAQNRPSYYTDPSGKLVWFLAIPLIMGASGAIAGGIWAAVMGQNIWEGIAAGAFGGLLIGAGAAIGIAFAGGAAAIGTVAGTVLGGLGAGIVGGAVGAITTPQAPLLGAFVGFFFGFLGGAIAGAGTLPFWGDLTQSTILNAPPVPPNVVPKKYIRPKPVPIGGAGG
ncbi:MAG: hypothetical protein IPM57_03830 [Oligoflexia bacterium]|nr:hypothetical protein [Oligoflexia bacterium]